MKARIKATGEIFKVMEYSHDAKGGYVVLSGAQVMKADCVELILESNHTDWEQRRYEIARDIMAAQISDGESAEYNPKEVLAKWAVTYADALIKELKGGKE